MANAGCINAIGFDGTYLRTLNTLDSANIGVGVQYCIPAPLDDKRLDYIKYTDKCGCTCCITGENEILVYATQGVLKNFTLTNDDTNERVIVKWNDLFGSNRAYTMVRYKTGSYPTSITDGTLAVKETTQNQYSVSGYNVSGLTDGTTYYFTAFAVDSNNNVITSQNKNITPDFGWHVNVNTILYLPFEEDLTDKSGKGTSVSVGKSSVSIATLNSIKCAYFNQGIIDTGIYDDTFNRTAVARIYIVSGEVMMLNSNPCGVFQGHYIIWASNTLTYGRYVGNNSTHNTEYAVSGLANGRHLFGWSGKCAYLDGQKIIDRNSDTTSISPKYLSLNGHANGSNCTRRAGVSYMKDVIVENIIWSDEDWLKYYNKTKKNYGDKREDFQEVQYIQSSGTQRIDTGVRPNDTTYGFKGKVSFNNMTSGASAPNVMNLGGTSVDNYRYGFGAHDWKWHWGGIMSTDWGDAGSITQNTQYDFSYNYNSDRNLIVNGNIIKSQISTGSYTYNVNWNIFCQSYGSGSYDRFMQGKIYYMKIYKGTTLIRDFVPCYRKSDNVIGLYDKVNYRFYTNSGSGTFTKGPNIN